jgi:hypothetical protein
VLTGQKLDLLDRETELGALEDPVGSGDAGGVLAARRLRRPAYPLRAGLPAANGW